MGHALRARLRNQAGIASIGVTGLTGADEAERFGNDFGGGAGLVVLIHPFAVAHRANDGNLSTTFEVFVKDFGELTKGFDPMPVGLFLPVTVPVFVDVSGRQRELGDDGSARERFCSGSFAEATDEVDEVAGVHDTCFKDREEEIGPAAGWQRGIGGLSRWHRLSGRRLFTTGGLFNGRPTVGLYDEVSGIPRSFLLLCSVPATQKGELFCDDFCGGTDLLMLIHPLPVTHGANDRNLAATLQVLIKKLGQFTVGFDLVPLGAGLSVTRSVAEVFVGGQGELGGCLAGLQRYGCRISAKVAGKVDVVTYIH